MAQISRSDWLQLYKNLQRAALQFPQFNYRHFAARRIRDYFELNKTVTESQKLDELYKEGLENLEVLQRQTSISKLYPQRKLVIED